MSKWNVFYSEKAEHNYLIAPKNWKASSKWFLRHLAIVFSCSELFLKKKKRLNLQNLLATAQTTVTLEPL